MDSNVKSMFVKMTGIKDITDLVKVANGVEGDIEVRKGRWCVDAKSLMGVMSIDLSGGATIIYPSEATDFENYIKQFKVG